MKEGRLLVDSASNALFTLLQSALTNTTISIEHFIETQLFHLPESLFFKNQTSPRKQRIQELSWNLVWSSIPFKIKETSLGDSSKFLNLILLYLKAILRWTELSEELLDSNVQSERESLFMSCFDTIMQISTIGTCATFLNFFSKELSRIMKCALDSLIRKRQLLLMSTLLLKRANSTLNQDVVSLVLHITSRVFKFNDRSILNVKSTPNFENITNYDHSENIQNSPNSNDKSQFYLLLWRVQETLIDPKKLLETQQRPKLLQLLKDIDLIITKFAKVAYKQKEHLRNPAKEKLVEPAKQTFFCSKFLTSRELFDAQVITDPFFRRQILVEFLLFIGFLLFYSEKNVKELEKNYETDSTFKRNTNILPTSNYQWLSAEETETITKIRAKATIVLSRIPPNGIEFAETIYELLKYESKWTTWKMKYCYPEILPTDTVMLGEDISYQLSGTKDIPKELGATRLNRLWDTYQPDIPSLPPHPDILEWTKQLEDEARGDIEPEYQLSKKEMWKWQTYRILLHSHFNVLSKPVSKHVLRDFIRRIEGKPEMTELELQQEKEEEEEERQREQERLELEMEEERRQRLIEEQAEQQAKEKEKEERMKLQTLEQEKLRSMKGEGKHLDMEPMKVDDEVKKEKDKKRNEEEERQRKKNVDVTLDEVALQKEKELQGQDKRKMEVELEKKENEKEPRSLEAHKKRRSRSREVYDDHRSSGSKPESAMTSSESRRQKSTEDSKNSTTSSSSKEEDRYHSTRTTKEDVNDDTTSSGSKEDRYSRRLKKWDENRPKLDVSLFNRLTSSNNTPTAAAPKTSPVSSQPTTTSSSSSSHAHSTSESAPSMISTPEPSNGRLLPPRPNFIHASHKDREKRSEILGRTESTNASSRLHLSSDDNTLFSHSTSSLAPPSIRTPFPNEKKIHTSPLSHPTPPIPSNHHSHSQSKQEPSYSNSTPSHSSERSSGNSNSEKERDRDLRSKEKERDREKERERERERDRERDRDRDREKEKEKVKEREKEKEREREREREKKKEKDYEREKEREREKDRQSGKSMKESVERRSDHDTRDSSKTNDLFFISSGSTTRGDTSKFDSSSDSVHSVRRRRRETYDRYDAQEEVNAPTYDRERRSRSIEDQREGRVAKKVRR